MSSNSDSEDEYSTESGEVEYSREGYNEEENESEDEENEDESRGGGGENEDDEVENEGGEEENEDERGGGENEDDEVENEGGEEENEDDESGDGGEDTENDVEEDPPSDVEDPKWIGALLQLWRLYVHVDLKNCDDLIPDWDYKSAAEEPMQIESMGVLTIHFLNEGPEQDRVHLGGGCPHCNQIYSVIMKDRVCKPCTQAYKTVPYFGVLMGFLVGNATPVRYLNPPLFKATVVVDNVAHTLRNIEPNRSTSITYEFMDLQQRKKPKVGQFKLGFYNEEMWAKAEVYWTRQYMPPMVHEADSEQSESGSDQD